MMEQRKKRYLYIDLLRGWAVVVMVEVHVTNAFLMTNLQNNSLFEIINFINGLVAPSFLFVAGYAFVAVGQRKWKDYLAFSPVFWKQIVRIAQILAVGYVLHIPYFSFTRLLHADSSAWAPFWKVDVLHCIAVSLLLLLILAILSRSKELYFALTTTIGCAVVLATPYVASYDIASVLPLPIANYFNALQGSLFPLFPWMGFVFLGGSVAQLWIWYRDRKMEPLFFKSLVRWSSWIIFLAIIASILPFTFYPPHDFWKWNPLYVIIRLCVVLILLSGLWYWEHRKHSGQSPVSIVGSESLMAYAFHLSVIYGLFFEGRSLAFLIGRTLNVPEVIIGTIVLLVTTGVVSFLWHRLKGFSMIAARIAILLFILGSLYEFISATN